MNNECKTCGVGYYLPSGHCNHCDRQRVHKVLLLGIMMERVYGWTGDEPHYRVFSGKMHGPICPTRREAFWRWFTSRFFNL